MAKNSLHRFSFRMVPLIGILLPFLLLLVVFPESTDSADVGDYLPSSRVRGVAIQIGKSLKATSTERAGSSGSDVAVNAQFRDVLFLQTSLRVVAQIQHRIFDICALCSARSPPLYLL